MATHSSILAWRIPWNEDPDGLRSVESQRVRHDRATLILYKPIAFFISGVCELLFLLLLFSF